MGSGVIVDPSIGRVRFDPGKTLWLWGMVIGSLFVRWNPRAIGASIGLTFLTVCIGHSVGLHRGTIHRSYAASPFVRRALLYLGVLSGLGGPLAWARFHAVRDYWQNHADCPPYFAYDHSLARDFLWNLHTTLAPADDRALGRLPADLLDDPWLRFLDATWPLHVLLLALVLDATLGPEWVATCICARVAVTVLGHWFVGYAAHAWGAQPYVIEGAKESGTNVWLLGVLSFGEGFHNNHHEFPRSARYGRERRELDLGWLVVRGLARMGIFRDVRTS